MREMSSMYIWLMESCIIALYGSPWSGRTVNVSAKKIRDGSSTDTSADGAVTEINSLTQPQ